MFVINILLSHDKSVNVVGSLVFPQGSSLAGKGLEAGWEDKAFICSMRRGANANCQSVSEEGA